MELQSRLIELLGKAYQAEGAFVSALSEAERAAAGAPQAWSPKDVVAHEVAWRERAVQRLAAILRGDSPGGQVDDVDQTNLEIFEAHRHVAWADLLARSEEAYRREVELVGALSEAQLRDTQALSWEGGRPVWRLIAGNGHVHPVLHFAGYYAGRGQALRARQMHEEDADLLLGLDDSPAWHGTVIYNLACMHALAGEKAAAIEKLAEALRLDPELTDWSRQDPDFDAIRQDPAFQAVYQ